MNEMEQTAAEMLLAGDDPLLDALRWQLSTATVVERDFTGKGFFTTFAVDPDIPKASRGIVLDDVMGDVTGLDHGVFFLLFARKGVIEFLECAIVDDAWPQDANLTRAYYVQGSSTVVETTERDLEWVLRGDARR